VEHVFVERCATNASGSWTTTQLSNLGSSEGFASVVRVDKNDGVHVLFENMTLGVMIYAVNTDGVWIKERLNDPHETMGGGLALDAYGRAYVSYNDFAGGQQKYAVQRSAPSAPTLNTIARGNANVNMTWTAPVMDGGVDRTGYAIYRGSSTTNMTIVAEVASDATWYKDTGLTNGVTYYYAVSAINSEGYGARSGVLSATPATIPNAPLNLVTAAGDAQVKLSWDLPSSDGGAQITQYRVYRGTDQASLTYVGNTTGRTYTDTGLQNDKTYYYKVSAVNAIGEGAQSSVGQSIPRVDNTLLIVLIAVVVIAAVGAVVFVFIRRRH
jgi:hypothetical protein